jgi:Mitochondrial 28S ribosomal protein S22
VIVVREADGMLRTANPEEHDRMNRIYYPQKDKPVFEPAVFSDPHLTVFILVAILE